MQVSYRIESGRPVETTKQPAQWVTVTAPTAADWQEIAARYHLDVQRIKETLDIHEDPRASGLDQRVEVPALIVLRYPEVVMNELGLREYRTLPLTLIILEQTVLMFSKQPLPARLTDHLFHDDWQADHPEAQVLHILWCVLHTYVDVMDTVNTQVAEIERTLGHASRNEQLYEIMALQKTLIYFDSVLDNTMPILTELRQNQHYWTTMAEDDALAAVMVEAHQAHTMVTVTERILEQFNTAVSSIVSNNLNLIMKVLTSLTIILTIPTVIAGLWGMNVPVPFADVRWAFWGICAACAVLCGITAFILWRHDDL